MRWRCGREPCGWAAWVQLTRGLQARCHLHSRWCLHSPHLCARLPQRAHERAPGGLPQQLMGLAARNVAAAAAGLACQRTTGRILCGRQRQQCALETEMEKQSGKASSRALAGAPLSSAAAPGGAWPVA